jgi:ADP-glucose pyrophosphorylase
VGAAFGIDDRLDRLADAKPAVERAVVDDEAADGKALDSVVCPGCIVSGGQVRRSEGKAVRVVDRR